MLFQAQQPSSSQKLFTTLIIELLIVHDTLDFTQTATTLCKTIFELFLNLDIMHNVTSLFGNV